jgi:putative Flp pilus-assembly TadE/G-like protein
MTIAVVGMTAILGALSLVIDAGVYFVIQRQLQNAADAAALAAAWYDPSCDSTDAGWRAAGCQPTPGTLASGCPPASDPPDKGPCTAATNAILANDSVALSLCGGPTAATGAVKINVYPASSFVSSPPIRPYVVALECNAPHWFAHILPGVLPTMTIRGNSAAALGWLESNGGVIGGARPVSNPPLAARLVQVS